MRRTAPYLLTPIQRPRECQPIYLLGPEIGPSYDELRRQLEQARERLDNESALTAPRPEPGEDCGTWKGVKRHRNLHERPCHPCATFYNARRSERRKRAAA